MILVMLGTQNNSFTRLLDEIQKCIDDKTINEEVVVQAGSTKYKSKNMKIFKLIKPKELENYIKDSSFIISHGGVGSIVSSLRFNKKVIVVPRLSKYEEHVNDHQLQIVEAFDKQGFIKGVIDIKELKNAINELKDFEPQKYVSNNEKILNLIEDFINNN